MLDTDQARHSYGTPGRIFQKKLILKYKQQTTEKHAKISLTETLMSRDMRFPTMWYERPLKPQISLRICAV